jgi:protein-tyrosine phosphatase
MPGSPLSGDARAGRFGVRNSVATRWRRIVRSVPVIVPRLQTPVPPVELPERFNLRDLGGLATADGRTVAPGRLWRGAGLHQLEPAQVEALAPLEIRTAIDLRATDEVALGTFAGSAEPVRHLPIFETRPDLGEPGDDPAEVLAGAYLWILEQGPGSIREAIELLGEPGNLPAVVYCAAGKDRTGVVCALVLSLVGVDREAIAVDYALSDAPALALRDWFLANGTPADQLAAAGVFRAPRAAMDLFLAALDERHGSLDAYLESIGVDAEAARQNLRAALLT